MKFEFLKIFGFFWWLWKGKQGAGKLDCFSYLAKTILLPIQLKESKKFLFLKKRSKTLRLLPLDNDCLLAYILFFNAGKQIEIKQIKKDNFQEILMVGNTVMLIFIKPNLQLRQKELRKRINQWWSLPDR